MNKKDTLAVNTGLIAGRILIEGGSDMERINKTVREIVEKGADCESQVYTSLTAIIVGLRESSEVMLEEIEGRGINLEKIYQVDLLVKGYLADELTLSELYLKLKRLEDHLPTFPFLLRTLAAAWESAFLMIIFTQSAAYGDMFLTFLAGGVGYGLTNLLNPYTKLPFIREFLGSLALGLVALFGVKLGLAGNVGYVIVGAIMPLVPGVAITNSVRDLIEGNLLSGIERGFEAALTIFAVASALALILPYAQ